jgi:hypothetical protein
VHDLLVGSEEVDVRLYSGCDGALLFDMRPAVPYSSEWPSDVTGFARRASAFVDAHSRAFVLVALPEVDISTGMVKCYSVDDRKLVFVTKPPLDHDPWYFGSIMDVVGDVDGDGTPDFIAGSEDAASASPAQLYMCSGRTGEILWSVVRTVDDLVVEH